MREKEYNFECSSCGTEFTIFTHDDEHPEVCPWCGSDLENERDEEELEEE